jgi:hypothetical protein
MMKIFVISVSYNLCGSSSLTLPHVHAQVRQLNFVRTVIYVFGLTATDIEQGAGVGKASFELGDLDFQALIIRAGFLKLLVGRPKVPKIIGELSAIERTTHTTLCYR